MRKLWDNNAIIITRSFVVCYIVKVLETLRENKKALSTMFDYTCYTIKNAC